MFPWPGPNDNLFLWIIALQDSLPHFWFSALAGVMVFYATWIISWSCGHVESPLPSTTSCAGRGGRFTFLVCCFGALLGSSAAHNWWDKLILQ